MSGFGGFVFCKILQEEKVLICMVFYHRYLEVEWEVRKGNKRSFSKEVMKGSNPKVPQQNNFSDCGVYILQYVESFFEVCDVYLFV